MGWEWRRITGPSIMWLCAGALYIALPVGALIWLRGADQNGLFMILWLFCVVWSADSGAYFFGRAIGGPKFAPKISPKKTWAGFLGGILTAAILAGGFAHLLDGNMLRSAVFGLVVAVISQLGDLLESALKRHFDVKDSSNLIPGHGGLLDRVDGLTAGAVALAAIAYTTTTDGLAWT